MLGRTQANNEVHAYSWNIHTFSTCILTQEPGRFLPAESCALVVHSLQVSSCTAEHHGLLGFPGLEMDKTCLVARKTPSYILCFCCMHMSTDPGLKCHKKLYSGITQLQQGKAEGTLEEN